MLTETCCQIDLIKLFKNGFCTGHGALREPNDIRSYSALACIAIQANQNEMHGGQAVPNFDYALAPGVAKTFKKAYFKALSQFLQIANSMSEADADALVLTIKNNIQEEITFTNADRYGEALKNYLPEHQRTNGFAEITEAEAVRAHADCCGSCSCDLVSRSEERRVGKECRSRWSPYH